MQSSVTLTGLAGSYFIVSPALKTTANTDPCIVSHGPVFSLDIADECQCDAE